MRLFQVRDRTFPWTIRLATSSPGRMAMWSPSSYCGGNGFAAAWLVSWLVLASPWVVLHLFFT